MTRPGARRSLEGGGAWSIRPPEAQHKPAEPLSDLRAEPSVSGFCLHFPSRQEVLLCSELAGLEQMAGMMVMICNTVYHILIAYICEA